MSNYNEPFLILYKNNNPVYFDSKLKKTNLHPVYENEKYLKLDFSDINSKAIIEVVNNMRIILLDKDYDLSRIFIKKVLFIDIKDTNIFFRNNFFMFNLLKITRVYREKVINKLPEHYIKLNRTYVDTNYLVQKSIKIEIEKNKYNKIQYAVKFKLQQSDLNYRFVADKDEADTFKNYHSKSNRNRFLEKCLA